MFKIAVKSYALLFLLFFYVSSILKLNRLKFFNNIKKELWNDWKWQISNNLSTLESIKKITNLIDSEKKGFDKSEFLSTSITPYYSYHVNSKYLRKTIIPSNNEFIKSSDEMDDPLGEEDNRVTPYIIHTYPDKVLFLATTFCSTYCRYCTRARLVGKPTFNNSDFESSYNYIKKNQQIKDVLISGGDPLVMSDSSLEDILFRLREISHIKLIRIGSKIPAVLPMRITDNLCKILKKYNVWLSLHFIHNDELISETREACSKLSRFGIPMVSQTVLLKNINDTHNQLAELFYNLVALNIKPYYLLQCDPIRGSKHFRTSIEKGINLIQSLHGTISGIAIPQYIIDAPGGGGKVPILSKDQIRRDGNKIFFKNYQNKEYFYPDLNDNIN